MREGKRGGSNEREMGDELKLSGGGGRGDRWEASPGARVRRGSASPRGRAPAGPWAISKEGGKRRPSRLD